MWDYDFQGITVDPLTMTALDYAAFANAASYQYGVLIAAGQVEAMTDQQRIDYLATLDSFLDGIHSGGYSGGSDQNSYYDRPWEDAAPLGETFIEMFGWMPHVQQMAGYQYWAYQTQDIDPELLEVVSDDYTQGQQTGTNTVAGDLSQLLLSSAMLGTTAFSRVWVDGYTYSIDLPGTENDEEVIVGGHWEIQANSPGPVVGNLYQQGDGTSFLAGLTAITADLATLVDAFFNEVALHPSITLTPEQAGIYAHFQVIVWAMKNEIAEIADNAVLTMPDGQTVTGAELKAAWARVDFQINPTGTYYPLNGTFRGQADWNYGDPIISLNLDMLEGYSSPAGLVYLALHEVGHLVQAGRNVNSTLNSGGYTNQELIYIEQYANTIGRAIAVATGQPFLPDPTHGFLSTTPEFIVPSGGSTGDCGGDTDGDTGGYTGGGGGGRGGWEDQGEIP